MVQRTKMTPEAYLQCVNLVGAGNLRAIVIKPRPILDISGKQVWANVSKAIYVIVDDSIDVAYVGKVDRKTDSGLSQRMSEHAQSPQKLAFRDVFILPLEEHVSSGAVSRFEGLVAAYLRPYHSSVHPKIPTWRG
jgi:hypothetical protein